MLFRSKESTKRTNSDEVTEVYSEYDILGRRIRLSSNLGADINYELDKLSNISKITAGDWEAKIDYDKLGLEIRGFYGDLFLGGDWDSFAFRRGGNIPIRTNSGINRESRSARKKPLNRSS